ncbi:MAG: DUF2461 domain-containing protein [Bacteroidota bacterium]
MNINPETLVFLKELKQNNNKPWFESNKDSYLSAKINTQLWFADLLTAINEFDTLEIKDPKKCMPRIYRDLRFSKDKTPYSPRLSAMIYRSKQEQKCNFYLHIEPSNSFLGGGLYVPTSSQLKLIRDDIDYDASDIKKVLNSAAFKNNYGELSGDRLIKIPKGFNPNHPEAELLKLKQYLVMHHFTDEEVCSSPFMENVIKIYKQALPLFFFFDRALSFKE